jgi:hypothetical protein
MVEHVLDIVAGGRFQGNGQQSGPFRVPVSARKDTDIRTSLQQLAAQKYGTTNSERQVKRRRLDRVVA